MKTKISNIEALLMVLASDEVVYINGSDNIIKKVSKVLDLTYAELGDELSISGNTLNKLASTNQKISDIYLKVIELYLQNIIFKKEILEIRMLKESIKKFFT